MHDDLSLIPAQQNIKPEISIMCHDLGAIGVLESDSFHLVAWFVNG